MFAPCAFKKHAYLLRALQPRGRSRGYFRDVPRNCLSLGRDKAKASRVSSTYFPRTTKEIALPFETFVKTKRIRVAHLPTTTVSAPAMARALLQNPLSLLNARTKNLCSSQGVVQNTIPRRMDRKHKCAVRSEGFHGQPSSRSWDSGEEFLGDLFRDVVKFIFPGSKSTSSQDMILALDAYETLIAYVYYADVPGVPRDSLQVKIKDGLLILSGTRVLADTFPDFTGQRQKLGQERQQGDFIRAVQLPADACVKPGSIHAKVVGGVLEVTVEKAWGSQAPDIDEIKIQY